LKPNFLSKAASEFPTFFPAVHTLKSLVIWIWAFSIFVETWRAWKKLICDGSNPVAPGGMTKSIGETAPTLASVATLSASIFSLSSNTGWSVKIRPTLPFNSGRRAFNSGLGVPIFFKSS
jgi:hypothetical protein